MKKILIATIGLFGLLNFSTQAQTVNTATTTTKTSATLAAICTIASQNVNFGQLILPISSQSATSSMSVQCTKGSTYTIGLAYGGIYGQGGAPTGSYWVNVGCGGSAPACYNYGVWYYEYNSSGTKIAQQEYNWSAGQYPAGTSGASEAGVKNNVLGASYAYGKLTGSMSGDTIGYSIQVPNNPSEVWNNGNYTYASTGNGSSQSIPIIAKLLPAQTTNAYPTPDTYLDTVIANINY